MQDFLWAVVSKLRRLFPGNETAPVYFGRLLQGERRPCFYLPPPALRRRLLPCGRVRREIDLELHYYPEPLKKTSDKKAEGALGCLAGQERVGEGLARGMAELAGRLHAYRGHDLRWQAGNEYLCFQAKYIYYTTLELEAADKLSMAPENADLMQLLEIGRFDEAGLVIQDENE